MSVAARFQTLLGRLAPSEREIFALTKHRHSIAQRLKAVFGDMRIELIGSYSRGTAVAGLSDLDLMAYLPADEARWGGRLVDSDRLLARVRQALLGRFPNTRIGKDAQAVVVSFANGTQRMDVVPAYWNGMVMSTSIRKMRPLFRMPDGSGRWFDTSPQAHKTYIETEDVGSGGRLRRTAQLIKFWGACRGYVVLMSFHIELLLAESGICRAPGGYAQYVVDTFEILASRRCRALQDPLEISGYVPAARTKTQVEQTLSAVRTSLAIARRAREEELSKNVIGAYELWNRVFNEQFPSR